MNSFPEFMKKPVDAVAGSPSQALQGFLFQGQEGVQIVFWETAEGGVQPEHAHDFWEYALVVEGCWEGLVGGKEVRLRAGDECVIPPGTLHSGRYGAGYRAIDAFSSTRFKYKQTP